VLVVDKVSREAGGEGVVSEEMKGEWLDEGEIGRVEIEVVDGNNGGETDSVKSNESRQTRMGFDFLDVMTEEGKDEELEKVRKEGRKRKRGEDENRSKEGMLGTLGWEWREKEGREEKRRKREVLGWAVGEGDEKVRVKNWEKVPLPENFRLGLEERGLKMNHSGRPKNNFGTNRAPLFPGGKEGKQESRNWFASFTKSGCLSCRDKDGKVSHKSRTGDPVILVVGDETAPTVVGYTEKDSGEDTCAWVFKKEHMGLDEVGTILKKINQDKRMFDKLRGKREHEFFIPSGSKILVGSYIHLRREGLDGYISDFNSMVRDVWTVTGDIGIEVLPFVPVVMEGMDEVGRDLLGGLKDWVRWISEKSGRGAIAKLAETCGRESESVGCEVPMIWKPSFMLQHGRQGGWDVLAGRGNTLTLIRSERVEAVVERVMPAKEIEKMMGKEKCEIETVEEKRERGDFGKGISVEAEFAFTKALGDFCRKAVAEGHYKGNYRFNLRGQIEMRARSGEEKRDTVSVVFVGGSQMGRIKDEIGKRMDASVRVEQMVRIHGEMTMDKVNKALAELAVLEGYPEVLVFGGPGNSLMEHGTGENRGFGPERTVKVVNGKGGKGEQWEVRYHMEEPRRISMMEKRTLVDRMTNLVNGACELFPESKVAYVSTFLRHVERCCSKPGHMTEDDTLVMDSVRRDVDRDIKEAMGDMSKVVHFFDWWDLVGLDGEMTVKEVKRLGIIESDGVHLTSRACRNAAVLLCNRLRAMGLEEEPPGGEDDDVEESTSGRKKFRA
jgi:hypothetical protein